jgi:putative phage-type endonuclease
MDSGTDYPIVDPDPGQSYTRAKRAACLTCNHDVLPSSPQTSSTRHSLKHPPTSGWSTSTQQLPKTYTVKSMSDHVQLTGKTFKDDMTGSKSRLSTGSHVQQTLDRGFKFYFEKYIHNTECTKLNGLTYVRSRCYFSQKKHEAPHKLMLILDSNGAVVDGTCSCHAGASGCCNHTVGLLYTLDFCVRSKVDEFPEKGVCTENPQQWHKPRTEGLRADPIMESVVYRPVYGGKTSSGIQPSLYDARHESIRGSEREDAITLMNDLLEINPDLGWCDVIDTNEVREEDLVPTRFGFSVPIGSMLASHLAISEGNFNVISDLSSVDVRVGDVPEEYPSFPLRPVPIFNIAQPADVVKRLEMSAADCRKLERDTATQSNSTLWHDERKLRVTASNVGDILRRKSRHRKFVEDRLVVTKDLSHVPAIAWGRQHEDEAAKAYHRYMQNIGRPVTLKTCGMVVNPDFPWLAASPDRLVVDSSVGYGLVEVKCPYSTREVDPAHSARNDTSSCCELVDEKPRLKRAHNYYAQVQCQLGVTGAKWCDFVVWTTAGMLIERVTFDEEYWSDVVPKLRLFYVNHVVPVLQEKDLL